MLLKGTLKEKQEQLKEMNHIVLLEETGKVNVSDLEMKEVYDLQEVLTSLNYITKYENDYLVLENMKEKEEYYVNEAVRSLNKNKGGSGGYTYKVSLPVDFIRDLEMEDEDQLKLSVDYENKTIVIEKIDVNETN